MSETQIAQERTPPSDTTTTASTTTASTVTAASAALPLPALASHVCNTCRSRKKRCDKVLPTCGYCLRRSLSCAYQTPTSDCRQRSSSISASQWEKILPSSPQRPTVTQESQVTHTHYNTPSPSLLVDSTLEPFPLHLLGTQRSRELTKIDHILHLKVHSIIRDRGCYLDDITSKYFSGLHRWVPVISRDKFHSEFVNCRNPWPAEFSTLLLAIFLVVWQPPPDPVTDDEPGELHVVIKMLFAQVQAVVPPSTRLVQAGLLISIFEYAHELRNAAFVSIATCARMALLTGSNAYTNSQPRYETEEERNLWWGIVIYERVIACQSSTFGQPFLTECPSMEDGLPTEPDPLDRTPESVQSKRDALADRGKENIGSFGRLAQAAILLSRTIENMKLEDIKARHEKASATDIHLQELLGIVLRQGEGSWRPYCGAVAIIINALFILHQCVVDQASSECAVELSKESSLAALDSLTRMVIDIAYSFNQQLPVIDKLTFPPMCVFLVRAAIYNCHRIRGPADDVRNRDIKELSKMLQYYNKRWKIGGE